MKIKKARYFSSAVLLAGLLLWTACGYYSFKGALPPHIKTIAIPIFDSQTPDPGVAEKLNELLMENFINDNTLKVVDESKADLILNGTVLPIRVQPAVVRSGEEVAEDKLTVRVKVKCEDVKTSKVLFDQTFEHYVPLSINASLDDRQQAIDEALKIIADKILNATFSTW
jgi:outer membrane lipopolysaccharide assembly protein LptE/RlpB